MTDDIPYTNLENNNVTLIGSTDSLSSQSSQSSKSSKSSKSSESSESSETSQTSLSSVNSDIDCSICFNTFTVNDKVTLPCCKKKICSKCIFDWHIKKRGTNCMFCRKDIVEVPLTRENFITIISNDNSSLDRSNLHGERNHCISCIMLCFAGFIITCIYLYNQHASYNN